MVAGYNLDIPSNTPTWLSLQVGDAIAWCPVTEIEPDEPQMVGGQGTGLKWVFVHQNWDFALDFPNIRCAYSWYQLILWIDRSTWLRSKSDYSTARPMKITDGCYLYWSRKQTLGWRKAASFSKWVSHWQPHHLPDLPQSLAFLRRNRQTNDIKGGISLFFFSSLIYILIS